MLDARSKRMPFPQTIPALLIAPLGAIAALTGQILIDGRADPAIWIYWPFVALVCYVVEALFVVPFLLLWPQLRRPTPALGAAWGVLVSWCFFASLTLLPTTGPGPSSAPPGRFSWPPHWHGIAFFSVCGLLSGLVYSLASRASSRPRSN
jgi:hypothetical protein